MQTNNTRKRMSAKKVSEAPLRSLELFAGAGGLALGMTKAKIQHVGVVEWNSDACETIRRNRLAGHSLVDHWPDPTQGDVRALDFEVFAGLDIVSGGPPCQPFSMGGKHKAFLDIRDMFPQAVRAVREVRPKAFLFENVRGLTRPAFATYFSYILLQMEFPSLAARSGEEWMDHLARLERHKTGGGKSDYRVVFRVLDAADYGVPQRRHRVVFVGVREDLDREFSFPSPTHTHDRLLFDQFVSGIYWERHRVSTRLRPVAPPMLVKRMMKLQDTSELSLGEPWRTVRDAVSDLPDPEKHPNNKVQAHRFQHGARIYPGHTGSPLDEPSKALKAGGHGVPGGENMLRKLDGSVRYFTVRESARIQTFPDDYHFAGSWGEVMRQLGNAVPVDLGKAVAERLAKVLT
jgi:DNA (cytosine-5)-methyltransferase 1